MIMNEHSFKVGDKVKVKNPKEWCMNTRIGTIVGFDTYIRVTYDGGDALWNKYPHLACEIEKVPIKGQQLLFSFMPQ